MRYMITRPRRRITDDVRGRAVKMQMALDEARGVLRELEVEERAGMEPIGDDCVTVRIKKLARGTGDWGPPVK